jgi:hypothetical protein
MLTHNDCSGNTRTTIAYSIGTMRTMSRTNSMRVLGIERAGDSDA